MSDMALHVVDVRLIDYLLELENRGTLSIYEIERRERKGEKICTKSILHVRLEIGVRADGNLTKYITDDKTLNEDALLLDVLNGDIPIKGWQKKRI